MRKIVVKVFMIGMLAAIGIFACGCGAETAEAEVSSAVEAEVAEDSKEPATEVTQPESDISEGTDDYSNIVYVFGGQLDQTGNLALEALESLPDSDLATVTSSIEELKGYYNDFIMEEAPEKFEAAYVKYKEAAAEMINYLDCCVDLAEILDRENAGETVTEEETAALSDKIDQTRQNMIAAQSDGTIVIASILGGE